MQVAINQIESKIKNFKRGKIFFLDDFAGLGTPEAIKKSLQRLTNTPIVENALKNKDLFQSIVAHRCMFTAMKGFDYDTLSPKTIKIIPPDRIISKWEDDYNKMQTMIYGKTLLFNEIIDKIVLLNEKTRRLEW